MEFRDANLLRIFFSEDDVHDDGRPLVEAILRAAHAEGLAGATVLHGRGGYAPSGLEDAHFQFRREALPIIVEIVDVAAKIADFLPTLDRLVVSGAVTVTPVRYAAISPSKE
jgi:PII-like signaling protein